MRVDILRDMGCFMSACQEDASAEGLENDATVLSETLRSRHIHANYYVKLVCDYTSTANASNDMSKYRTC